MYISLLTVISHSFYRLQEYRELTFPEMESILLNCLRRPRIGVLHVPQVISSFDNTQGVIEINLKRCNCLCLYVIALICRYERSEVQE